MYPKVLNVPTSTYHLVVQCLIVPVTNILLFSVAALSPDKGIGRDPVKVQEVADGSSSSVLSKES